MDYEIFTQASLFIKGDFLVGRKPTLVLLAYFVANVHQVQWTILQTPNDGSVFTEKMELSDARYEYSYGRSMLRCYVQFYQTTYKRIVC